MRVFRYEAMSVDFVLVTAWFLMVCLCYEFMFWGLPLITQRMLLLDPDRRKYIIKNALKSILLLILAIFATPPMWRLFVYGVSDNAWMHTLGVLYAIPDVYSLWWLRNAGPSILARTTIFHHIAVGILASIGLFQDYSIESHWSAMVMYAYLSMWTGIVNFYLAVNWVLDRTNKREDAIRVWIARSALTIYVACCALNWSYQLYVITLWLGFKWEMLSHLTLASIATYFVVVMVVVVDDVILIRSLLKKCHPFVAIAKKN